MRQRYVNRSKVAVDLNSLRVCTYCDKTKPVTEFFRKSQHGDYFRKYCNDCAKLKRRLRYNRSKNRLKHHAKFAKYLCVSMCGSKVWRNGAQCVQCRKQSLASLRQLKRFPCSGDCGAILGKERSLCRVCRRLKNDIIAQSAESKVKRRRLNRSVAFGNAIAVMYVGTAAWALTDKCRRCSKPVIYAKSLCYECKTGQSITLPVRPKIVYSEKSEQSVAA